MHISKKINFQWILLYQNIYSLISNNINNFNFTFHNVLKKGNLTQLKNLEITKPIINRSLTSKLYFKTPRFLTRNQARVSSNSNVLFYNIFLIYLQYTTLSSHQFFVPHTNFKHLFLFSQYKNSHYINLPKIYAKWQNTCNFILNLFFIKSNLIVFTIKTLKTEALSFNWSFNVLNYNLFKYASPMFFSKDTSFGIASTLIFKKLSQNNVNTVFLTDVKYHEKNLYYLKKFNITTIGLVSYNLNPWLVTYAIPTATNSLFIQYFFIKLLIYFQQYSLNRQYNLYKQLW